MIDKELKLKVAIVSQRKTDKRACPTHNGSARVHYLSLRAASLSVPTIL